MAKVHADHQDPATVRKGFYYVPSADKNFFLGMDVIAVPDAVYYQNTGDDHLLPPRAPHDPEYPDGSAPAMGAAHFARIYGWSTTDFRVPITYVGTNAGRVLGTNGMTGRMWQDFSSESYRNLSSVGAISCYNPFTHQDESLTPRRAVPPGVAPGLGVRGFCVWPR